MKVKKKTKKKIPNTKRNHHNKVSRSKSVKYIFIIEFEYSNNRRRLEKRINFYRVQNICNHFHRSGSGHRRESNNTPAHKKNNFVNETTIKKGAAPVPSITVRQSKIFETKKAKLNTTKKIKTKKKSKLSMAGNNTSNKIDLGNHDYKNEMNSNRIIEPFSPTFEHPEDFLPSNNTSFRTPNILGESKKDEICSGGVSMNKTGKKLSIKGTNMTAKREIRLLKSNHNNT